MGNDTIASMITFIRNANLRKTKVSSSDTYY